MRKKGDKHSLSVVLRLDDRPVILVGTGAVADAQRRLLERAGARIVEEGSKAVLAVVVDDAGAVSRLKVRGALVYAVDRPDLSDFTPSAAAIDEPAPEPAPAEAPDRAAATVAPAPAPAPQPAAVDAGTPALATAIARPARPRIGMARRIGTPLRAMADALAAPLAGALTATRRRLPGARRDHVALDVALAIGGPLQPLAAGTAAESAIGPDRDRPAGDEAEHGR